MMVSSHSGRGPAGIEVCGGMCKTLAGTGCYLGVVRRKSDLAGPKAEVIRQPCTVLIIHQELAHMA